MTHPEPSDEVLWKAGQAYFETISKGLGGEKAAEVMRGILAMTHPASPAQGEPLTDRQRCITARNRLWAALDAPGSILGSLEDAVDTACMRLSQGEPHAGNAEPPRSDPDAPAPSGNAALLALLDYCDLSDDHQYGTLSVSLVRELVNAALTSPPQAGAKEAGALTDAGLLECLVAIREGAAKWKGGWSGTKDMAGKAIAILAKSGAGEARDAARYRWLKPRLFGADFEYSHPPVNVITFLWPKAAAIGADLDGCIDAAMTPERPEP